MFNTVAVVGATGAVGRIILQLLAERNFPARNYRFLASARSAGQVIDCVFNLSDRVCPWPGATVAGRVLAAVNGAGPGTALPPYGAAMIEGIPL